jgi:hypothetical protein
VVTAYLLGLGTGRLPHIVLQCPKEDSPVEVISAAIAGIVMAFHVGDSPAEAAVSAATVDIVLLRPVADPPVEAATAVTVEVATVDMGDRTARIESSPVYVYRSLVDLFFLSDLFGEGHVRGT